MSSGVSSFHAKVSVFGKVHPGTNKTFTNRLHLVRGIYHESHKKSKCSFGPPQNALPTLHHEEDSEGAIPVSDKET